jgi:choline dehydrogenase-like flavoprotein
MVAPVRRPVRPPVLPGWPLTPAQRATIGALAQCIVPVAATPEGGGVDIAQVVAERLARLPAHKRTDLLRALTVFGHPIAALLTTGGFTRFASRAPDAQAAMLDTWLTSRVALMRTIASGLRRIVLAFYYGDPRSHASIGYLGAYHERVPAFPWEGPAPGEPSDDEPIARGPLPQVPPPAPTPRMTAPGNGPLPRSADVVVIGTGAGGGVAACRLAEAGRQVVVLDSGPLLQSDTFDEQDAAGTERLWAEQGLRATDDASLVMAQGAAVGGSTSVNWMIMLRAPDHVLLEWSRRFGTQGMSPAHMAEHYARVEADTNTRQFPDDAHSPVNRLILDGAATLGWSARGGAINAKGCLRCGFCSQGCRYDARQGTLVSYLPRAVSAGAMLVPDAEALRIEVVEPGPRGRKRVHVRRLNRTTGAMQEETIEAPVVIVAGGAVGTPALLQRSGLGSPAVGRYLRVHPVSGMLGVYDRPIYAAAGTPLTTLCDEFLTRGVNGYGTWIETPPMHPMLVSTALPGGAVEHRALMRRFAELAVLLVLTRDGAELDASSGEVRALPNGRTSIRYALTSPDAANLRQGLEAAARLHMANGAREVQSLHTKPVAIRREDDFAALHAASVAPNDVSLFTAHVNGTCRLGTDPATSGANPDGQVHGVPGVYVFDGSLLPTGLGVNPQATIMALSSMLSDRLLARNAV